MIINFHSITDLITNSSTTIYTYSDSSPWACKEMIDEIFKVLGVDKKCDDVFTLTVLLDCGGGYDYYQEWLDRNSQKYKTNNIEDVIEDVLHGKIEKPEWMIEAENGENNCDWGRLCADRRLHVVAKSPEFENLSKLIVKFLYSNEHEAVRED